MKEIIVYTDYLGGRKSKYDDYTVDLNKKSLFIIGDSFIYADEVEYEKTFYGLINNKSKEKIAYAFAFSSWNTRQYLNSIKLLLKEKKTYDIYLFENDFLPNEVTSYYKTEQRKEKINKAIQNKSNFFIDDLYYESFSKYKQMRMNFKWKMNENKRREFWEKYYKSKIDCRVIDLAKKVGFSKTMEDRVVLTTDYSCWPDLYKMEYEYAMIY